MLRPAYRLTLGGRTVDTTDEPRASTLVALTVSLGLDAPVDAATLVLGQVGGLRPRQGDTAAIELGYADGQGGLTKVITGTVASVESGITTARVTVEGGLGPLLRTFVDETFESKTAGAIARDLAGRGGVAVAEAEDGPQFPAYVVDGRRSALRHVRDLAALAGFDAYADEQGRLVFRAFKPGGTVRVMKRGQDLVSLGLWRGAAAAGAVEAFGESPAGSEGAEAWGWLTDDPSRSKGSAGSGATLLLERPVLRTAETTAAAAKAALATLTRGAVRGEAVVPGRPAVRPGDAVRLEETGAAGADGTWQVRSVVHRLTKAGGFTTTVGFRPAT